MTVTLTLVSVSNGDVRVWGRLIGLCFESRRFPLWSAVSLNSEPGPLRPVELPRPTLAPTSSCSPSTPLKLLRAGLSAPFSACLCV